MQVTTIGLDIAKSVFQVHGVDEHGRIVLRKRLARARVLEFFANLPRCVIGLEACGGAHHWSRGLVRLGHDARLMPPQDVKARRAGPALVVGSWEPGAQHPRSGAARAPARNVARAMRLSPPSAPGSGRVGPLPPPHLRFRLLVFFSYGMASSSRGSAVSPPFPPPEGPHPMRRKGPEDVQRPMRHGHGPRTRKDANTRVWHPDDVFIRATTRTPTAGIVTPPCQEVGVLLARFAAQLAAASGPPLLCRAPDPGPNLPTQRRPHSRQTRADAAWQTSRRI